MRERSFVLFFITVFLVSKCEIIADSHSGDKSRHREQVQRSQIRLRFGECVTNRLQVGVCAGFCVRGKLKIGFSKVTFAVLPGAVLSLKNESTFGPNQTTEKGTVASVACILTLAYFGGTD